MKNLLNKDNQEVLELFLSNNMVVDDHKYQDPKEVYALVEFNSNHKGLGAALNHWCYCINEIYSGSDGKLHLSEFSIGGNLYGIPTREKVEAYNEASTGGPGRLIKRVWFYDGTVLEFDLGDEDLSKEK